MKFTVFTPTYNRAHTLPRLFESLLWQTCQDFEWLVVDDGSSDATAELLFELARLAPFPVVKVRQPHSGKHIAHNRALKLAGGEFFLVTDSDDELAPWALETLDRRWNELTPAQQAVCCGVAGLCIDPDGNEIGDRYTEAMRFSTLAQRRYVQRMKGEHWGSVKTDIARAFPFPDIPDFVPEGLVWLQMSKAGWKDYCVNDPLRVYHAGEPDALSRLRLTRGQMVYARYLIRYHWASAMRSPVRFARALGVAALSAFLLPAGLR